MTLHPGYSWICGPTTYYETPGGPFYWARYDVAPKGAPTNRHFGWAQTMDEARQSARKKS